MNVDQENGSSSSITPSTSRLQQQVPSIFLNETEVLDNASERLESDLDNNSKNVTSDKVVADVIELNSQGDK